MPDEKKDKDEKRGRVCPACGKDHNPEGKPSTEADHLKHHTD